MEYPRDVAIHVFDTSVESQALDAFLDTKPQIYSVHTAACSEVADLPPCHFVTIVYRKNPV